MIDINLIRENPELVKENISLFTIDSSFVDEYRSSFPVKEDRQVELYKQIL